MKYYAMPLISGKHYNKKDIEFDYIEPKPFRDIFEKTDARVIGSIRLKETDVNSNDIIVIESNSQTFQYNIDPDDTSHIMGYILVSDDTYVAVKKGPSPWLPRICFSIICDIAICCIAAYILWLSLS